MKKTTLNKSYAVHLDGVEQAKYDTLNMAKPLYYWLVINYPDREVKILKTHTEIIEI